MEKENVIEHLIDKFRSKLIRFKAGFHHIKNKIMAIGSYKKAVEALDAKTLKLQEEINQYDSDDEINDWIHM
jgi:hypothetical protein